VIRVLTISREYGRGGASIAEILSRRLGWRLIDDCLIAQIAQTGKTSAEAIQAHQETVDPWFHRIMKALWRGGFEGAVASAESEAADADAIARLWHRVILEAAAIGDCVTVGRGGQCLLQEREDTFHVYVYGPMRERVERLRTRESRDIDLAAAARDRDQRRAAYIRHYFNQEWTNPHLYQLMVCSGIGVEKCAETILRAAGLDR
jgi:cytidylate kinase